MKAFRSGSGWMCLREWITIAGGAFEAGLLPQRGFRTAPSLPVAAAEVAEENLTALAFKELIPPSDTEGRIERRRIKRISRVGNFHQILAEHGTAG